MNFRDVELLSEYLDGRLAPSVVVRLEARLRDDQELRSALDDLRTARNLLRALPRRKAPRNFALRPSMRRLSAPAPPAFPILRLASVVASLLFLGTVAANQLVPLAANRQAMAPAAAYGMGGGGGGGAAEAATPMPPAAAAPMATAPSLLAAAPSAPPEATQAMPDLQAKSLPQPPVEAQRAAAPQPPVPALWQWILASLAVVLALGAWALRAASSRRFRQQISDRPGH